MNYSKELAIPYLFCRDVGQMIIIYSRKKERLYVASYILNIIVLMLYKQHENDLISL